MITNKITNEVMNELIKAADDARLRRRLGYIYGQIPLGKCADDTRACFTSADVFLSEFINIYAYIQTLPAAEQKKIAKRSIAYELLNPASLDYKCPFLKADACLIKEIKPAQCRFFGLYPDDEYKELRETGLKKNIQLAQYYARVHRLLLPKEVITYDVDQCEQGEIFSRVERDLVYNQLVALNNQIFPEAVVDEDEDDISHFTYLYALTWFDERELNDLRLDVLREYLTYKTKTKLQEIYKKHNFDFGLAEVKQIKQAR